MLRELAALWFGMRAARQAVVPPGVALRGLLWTVCGCVLLFGPQATALPPSDPGVGTTATVPASNEAMLLFSRVEQAIQQADWRLALALRERLMTMGDELVVAPPGRTYYPIWRQTTKLFERLPAEGRDLYRQLNEADAAARLREVAPTGDIAALRALFRTCAGLSTWPAIGGELISRLLDEGQYAEVIETIQVLGAAQPQLPPERRAQLAVALAALGHWQAALDRLDQLAGDPAVQNAPWPERLAAIRDWIKGGLEDRSSEPVTRKLEPAVGVGPLWCELLKPTDDRGYDDDLGVAEAIALTRRLPLQSAVIEGDTLLTRMRGTIWAFDTLTLCPRWRVQELARGSAEQREPPLLSLTTTAELSVRRDGLSADASRLLFDALRHGISSGAGMVFTIEAEASVSGADDEFGMPRLGGVESAAPPNELVARELATGNVVWRRGHDPADQLFGTSFQDAPILVNERLCVPLVRGAELHLCLLNPASGETITQMAIVGPPTVFTRNGGRCQIVRDESSIYVATGNGVVAAVSAADLSWKWATTYPSTLAARRANTWWPPADALRESSIDRPLLAGELLILAPIDAGSIFAFERATGRQRWRIERRTDTSLVGVTAAGVLFAGSRLSCIDQADGATVRWRTVPLDITGRPATCAQRVFVPTRDGVVTVDDQTGKVLSEPPELAKTSGGQRNNGDAQTDTVGRLRLFSRHLPTANLIAAGDAIFAVSPNSLAKFPDLQVSREACAARLTKDPADERARIADIWLDFLGGDFAAALAKAEDFQPGDTELAVGRDKLLTDIFLALSGSLGDQVERLALLRRAAQIAKTEDVSTRLALQIGRVLEESGRWPEAAQHYHDLLVSDHQMLVADTSDPHHLQAVWLQAAARLLRAAKSIDASARDALWQDWLSSGSPEFLARLRLATADPNWQARIDRALAMSALPVELRARYLMPDDPALPRRERRELHLSRWDIHARLGLADEAAADQRYWQDQLTNLTEYANSGGSQPSDGASGARDSDFEADRVRRLESATAELTAGGAARLIRELNGRYCWKLPNAELIMDAERRWAGPSIVVRQMQDRVIGLNNVVLGRQYKEIPEPQEGNSAVPLLEQMAQAWWVGGNDVDEGTFRIFWPAATDGYVTALAVRGGLLGLGLGCERGDHELWNQALPEWSGVSMRGGEVLAAGEHGVYVAWRQDHVALLGWLDGAPRWERSLPGSKIEHLLPVGQRLIIAGRDGEVISVDALYGDDRRTLTPVGGVPRAVAAVASTVVVWTEERVAGYDPVSLDCRWVRASRGLEDWSAIAGSDWVAYREHGETDWRLISAVSGDPVFGRGLGPVGKVTAGVLEGERLFVAGFERKSVSGDVAALVRLTAFDSGSGTQLWQQELPSLARVNETQLRASPDLIPVLVARSDYEYTETRSYSGLALRMVDKQTGEVCEPVSILDDFRGTQGQCTAYLFATPSRIIVQANGTIAAYGPPSGKPR